MATETQAAPEAGVGAQVDSALARGLEKVLTDLTAQYERLALLARVRMDAMRRANTAALSACIAEESAAIQLIAEIDKRRVRLVGELAKRLSSPAGIGTSLTWIAERLPANLAEGILQRAQRLRELMSEVRDQNQVASVVAERLSRHMEGLWAQVAGSLNHSRTYGRMGSVQPGPQVVSALDMTS